jgi:hypothetical protein
MTNHDRGDYHSADWAAADRSARRIVWTGRVLMAIGFAAGWCVADYLGVWT